MSQGLGNRYLGLLFEEFGMLRRLVASRDDFDFIFMEMQMQILETRNLLFFIRGICAFFQGFGSSPGTFILLVSNPVVQAFVHHL